MSKQKHAGFRGFGTCFGATGFAFVGLFLLAATEDGQTRPRPENKVPTETCDIDIDGNWDRIRNISRAGDAAQHSDISPCIKNRRPCALGQLLASPSPFPALLHHHVRERAPPK